MLGTTREYDLIGNGTGWTEKDILDRLKDHHGCNNIADMHLDELDFHFTNINKPLTIAMGDGRRKQEAGVTDAQPTVVQSFIVSEINYCFIFNCVVQF